MTSEAEAVGRVLRGIGRFADEMRAMGIHVGLGSEPHCVTCGEPWPCPSSIAADDSDAS